MQPSNSFSTGTYHLLQKERLNLTPLAPATLSELYQLFIDSLVRRYLLDGEVVKPEWVIDVIQKIQNLFEQSGYSSWALQEKGKQPLIGFSCGYWYFHPQN